MVELDVSEVGVGAILSQCTGEKSMLHPIAYFSKNLSPAECVDQETPGDQIGVGEVETLARGHKASIHCIH